VLKTLVIPTGFEPVTHSLEGCGLKITQGLRAADCGGC